eukprot:CAMPEP_0118705094 /NCGR_PEP_ID=MMETSP0800-20121206/19656_1 /TAXON_ID=210618 ORGANISM="Striatella unipunctata, Strain CCMP2910" /NCGR_SAMPLE_ID=MMETSP0800 /ASSEMBLY_ACC=CAM_ASM_000638 /LENGTH=264 /DNA_ID=CAMNT_0006607169 /DNA_START=438 /DNA_END=1232 /DNA_ORIENTATION=+
MTALYLAIKLHAESGVDDILDLPESRQQQQQQQRRKKLKLVSFVELSRGQFSQSDIVGMERTMLDTLSWRVNPPTPMTMVSYTLRLMPPLNNMRHYDLVMHVLHELSRYLTELSVCLANVSSNYLPSHVAYASILISMDMLTFSALPYGVRGEFMDAVANVYSVATRGGQLWPETVEGLKTRIKRDFMPEMLIEDCDADTQHPISIARDFGLLDLDNLDCKNLGMHHVRNMSVTSVVDHHGRTTTTRAEHIAKKSPRSVASNDI